jgi:hypothetical protein
MEAVAPPLLTTIDDTLVTVTSQEFLTVILEERAGTPTKAGELA